jgi:hypothetical protein
MSTRTPRPSSPSTFSAGTSAVLEDQLAGVGAAHAELVELWERLKPGVSRSTMKAVMPREPASGVGLRVDHVGVRVGPVGDPHLGAVEHVAVAFAAARSFMETTSEPAPGSDMASAPTCSPEHSGGR